MGSHSSCSPQSLTPSPVLPMLWAAACVSFLSVICVCRCALSHFLVDFADTWLHRFYETHFTVWERSKENPTCDKAYGLYHYFPVLLSVAKPFTPSSPDIRFCGQHPTLVNLLPLSAPAKWLLPPAFALPFLLLSTF